ncbi:phosphoribosylformylglycinamidine synthase subunit PurQ [Candidatus Methanarcanum hacksteinii]|uniref:phosphoribosylformylglycinamidine synthase subunit PurQ n=1 Tax=Candidatus Methanarcanum hacksteinii TaxID=2911857 RepID=UPI0037DC0A33
MRPEDVRVCVLRIEGTNCEDEMYEAFKMVGASPEKVHLKQLTGQSPSELKRDVEDYDVLAFPGGFSAGDYVRAGAIFAARIRSAIGPQIRRFVESEKPVLGVCNGFQILVELGLLPALDDVMSPEPTAALYTNDSARFECRPTLLRNDNRGKCIFASEIPKKKVLMIPSAHAEGKLLSMDPRFVDRLEENDQIVFRYVGENGEDAEYPWNPNGSPSDIAGICNPAGNVLGMMPHPERVLTRFTHPDWTRGYDSEEGDGLCLFRSVMKKLV